MKSWKLLLAVALATVGVLLLTSIVLAAPDAKGSVQSAEMYDDTDPILTDTLPTTHPIGSLIALYFNIPYTQVMALHDQGFGFGNIARAYLTAYASDGVLTPEQVLAMRVAGVGWGQIKKDYGIHPGGNGLGSIKEKKPQPEPTSSAAQVKPGKKDAGSCPGNSCIAPGHQKPPKDKPSKGPKK